MFVGNVVPFANIRGQVKEFDWRVHAVPHRLPMSEAHRLVKPLFVKLPVERGMRLLRVPGHLLADET